MAGQIARAKAIVANLKSKDQVPPDNATLLGFADAFVRAYPSQWQANLARPNVGLVVNPDNPDDLFDIGTVTDDVFSAADSATKNHAKAFHFNQQLRSHVRAIYRVDQKKHGTASAGNAGQTAAQIEAALVAAALATAETELGDDDNQPES